MEAHLAECIHDALHTFTYKNAVFLAERLCASFPTEVRQQRLWRAVLVATS